VARLRLGDNRGARLRRPSHAMRSIQTRTVWGGDLPRGADQLKVGERWVNSRQYVRILQLQGSDQQQRVAKALRRRAQPPASRPSCCAPAANLLLLDEPT